VELGSENKGVSNLKAVFLLFFLLFNYYLERANQVSSLKAVFLFFIYSPFLIYIYFYFVFII